jgi:hypothetical protein
MTAIGEKPVFRADNVETTQLWSKRSVGDDPPATQSMSYSACNYDQFYAEWNVYAAKRAAERADSMVRSVGPGDQGDGSVLHSNLVFASMCGRRLNRPDQADPGIVDENVQPAEVRVSVTH